MPISNLLPSNLLLCLRPDTDQFLLSQLNAETWEQILKQAKQYYVVELLYQRLIREKPALTLPTGSYSEIRTAYYRTLADNSRHYAVLEPALAKLQEEGISVLLLKGAYLAEQVYGDIGLRPMSDFDLLVPHPDLLHTLSELRQAGFESQRDYFEETDRNLQHHAPALYKDDTTLEIHWSLVNPDVPLQIDYPGLWQRAVPVELQIGQARALAPLDLLVYLCIHSSYSHAFHNQLYSLCDICEVLIVQGDKLDWKAFIREVVEWNALKGVYLTLRLSSELLGAKVPGEVLAELEPPDFDPQAINWAEMQLFRSTPTLSANFSRVMRKNTPLERLRALQTALIPSRLIMSNIYSVSPQSWRLVWLYPYNVVTRLTSYWRHTLDIVKQDPQRIQEADSNLNLLDWLGIKG